MKQFELNPETLCSWILTSIRSESFVPHLGPSITVTKVVSSSEILESTEDEADVKIEDDIKIEEENLHIEVEDDVNMEDTETEKICSSASTIA